MTSVPTLDRGERALRAVVVLLAGGLRYAGPSCPNGMRGLDNRRASQAE
jgi:hypothetical protein